MFPGLTDAEQDQVIEAVSAAVERHLRPGAGAADRDPTGQAAAETAAR